MIVIDSVGWLAFFKGDPLSPFYRSYILNIQNLLCPTIIIYEVTKKIELEINRQAAALAAAQLLKTQVIPFDDALATAAARISIAHKLPMGDAIIYTTTLMYSATLITSDAHLEGLPQVRYIPHPNAAS